MGVQCGIWALWGIYIETCSRKQQPLLHLASSFFRESWSGLPRKKMPSFFAPSSNSLLSFTVYPKEIGYTLVKSVFVCFLLRIPVGVKKCRPLLPSFSSRSSASTSFSQSWTPLYARKSERFHKRLRILECWLPLLPFMCGLDAFSCMLLTSDKRYLQQSNSPRNLSETAEFHWPCKVLLVEVG